MRLLICTVSPEPFLLVQLRQSMDVEEDSDQIEACRTCVLSMLLLYRHIAELNCILIMGLVAIKPSSGFPTKLESIHSAQLQRLARKLKFRS